MVCGQIVRSVRVTPPPGTHPPVVGHPGRDDSSPPETGRRRKLPSRHLSGSVDLTRYRNNAALEMAFVPSEELTTGSHADSQPPLVVPVPCPGE